MSTDVDPPTSPSMRGPSGPAVDLSKVGTDPDPRFTFANERTFLAWNRTALAFVAAGLAAAELLRFEWDAARLIVALPLIALGGAISYNSYRRWEVNERSMRLGRPLSYPRLPQLLAQGTALVAAVTALLVVADLVFR